MNPIKYVKSGAWKGTAKAIGYKFYEARPGIMLGLGGLSMLIGTIYACKKTVEAQKIVEDTKALLETEEKINAATDKVSGTVPTKEEKIQRGKKLVWIYVQGAWKLVKVYALPAALWGGGLTSIVAAHNDLRARNGRLLANSVALQQLFQDYRKRNAALIGEEAEKKLFMGAQEGTIQVIEKDEKTGEEKIVEKKADVFIDQPGSLFARNFTAQTSDAFDIRSYADYFLDSRIEQINTDLSLGLVKFLSGADILRRLGFNEDQIDENMIDNGISGNAMKVPDAMARKLNVQRLRGYEKKWDVDRGMWVYEPCLRLDFNFYPLKGMV